MLTFSIVAAFSVAGTEISKFVICECPFHKHISLIRVYSLGKVNPEREFGFLKVFSNVHFLFKTLDKKCM